MKNFPKVPTWRPGGLVCRTCDLADARRRTYHGAITPLVIVRYLKRLVLIAGRTTIGEIVEADDVVVN